MMGSQGNFKISYFEKMAGSFVLLSIFGVFVALGYVAIEKGWLERDYNFEAVFDRAEGLREGAPVEIAGLRAGKVTRVELRDDNKVLVKFEVSERFLHRIREDSFVLTKRPFIIGEKVLEVTLGSSELDLLKPGSQLIAKEGTDLLDLLNGQNIGAYVATLGKLAENLRLVADAFSDSDRAQNIVKIFDQLNPFLKNANRASLAFVDMSHQMTHKQNLKILTENMAEFSKEMSVMVKKMPSVGEDMAVLIKQSSLLLEGLNKVLPVLDELGPQLPTAAKRAIEAIDEAVVVLKAMQRSFLLSGSAKDVRKEEEAKRKLEEEKLKMLREPAATPTSDPKDSDAHE